MAGRPKSRAKKLAALGLPVPEKPALPAPPPLPEVSEAFEQLHPEAVAVRATVALGPINRRIVPDFDTDEARKVVWEMSLAGISRDRIADYLGVTVDQLLGRYQKELKGATDEILGRVALSLAQKALMGDTQAQIAILKMRGGEAWKEKQVVEHTGKDGGPMEIDMKHQLVSKVLELVGKEKANPPMIDITPSKEQKP